MIRPAIIPCDRMRADQRVEIGVEHRLPPAEGDDRGAQVGELVDPRQHQVQRDRLRHLVVLVAVAAVDVAAADRHDVDEQRMVGGGKPAGKFPHGPHRTAGLPVNAHQTREYIRTPLPVRIALHAAADTQRVFEDGAHPQPAGQPVPRDGVESGRGDTAAVGAVRVPPELARGDVALEVRRHARGRLREGALSTDFSAAWRRR